MAGTAPPPRRPPLNRLSLPPPATALKTILAVLAGASTALGQGENQRLDLRRTDLRRTDLREAHLEAALLIQAHRRERKYDEIRPRHP